MDLPPAPAMVPPAIVPPAMVPAMVPAPVQHPGELLPVMGLGGLLPVMGLGPLAPAATLEARIPAAHMSAITYVTFSYECVRVLIYAQLSLCLDHNHRHHTTTVLMALPHSHMPLARLTHMPFPPPAPPHICIGEAAGGCTSTARAAALSLKAACREPRAKANDKKGRCRRCYVASPQAHLTYETSARVSTRQRACCNPLARHRFG